MSWLRGLRGHRIRYRLDVSAKHPGWRRQMRSACTCGAVFRGRNQDRFVPVDYERWLRGHARP